MILTDIFLWLQDFLYNVVLWWGQYFEVIFYANLAAITTIIVAYIFAFLTDTSIRRFIQNSLMNVFFVFYLSFIVSSAVMSIQVYRLNYMKPEIKFVFPRDVLTHTAWINRSFPLYYVKGSQLKTVELSGDNKGVLLTAEEPIREYHFSPDGTKILVVTGKRLYLVDLTSGENEVIDELAEKEGLDGVITGIEWAPDSRKFSYEASQWSRYAAVNKLFVYDVVQKRKDLIDSPTRQISSLRWDRQAKNLYYLYPEAKDTTRYAYAYLIKVYVIPLDTLEPRLIFEIPTDSSAIPIESLGLRDIDLFLDGDKVSWYKRKFDEDLMSTAGASIGIDKDDHLFYIPNRWFRVRLFKVPRRPEDETTHRYQYKGGELVLKNIRWLPGNRYVFMQHDVYGALILDVRWKKMGILDADSGAAMFGWYDPSIKQADDF